MSPLAVTAFRVLMAVSSPVMPWKALTTNSSATTSTASSTKVSSTRPPVDVRNTSPSELSVSGVDRLPSAALMDGRSASVSA